jgi:hypothetical protein
MRRISTALGWRLPDWLVDYGPIGFIALEGTIAIFVHEHNSGVSRGLLGLGLGISLAALLYRRRVPLAVLAVVLLVALGINYGPVVSLPVLLARFTLAHACETHSWGLGDVANLVRPAFCWGVRARRAVCPDDGCCWRRVWVHC